MTLENNVKKENQKEDEEELATIDGLKFEPYQMQCLKVYAMVDGTEDVRAWLNESIVNKIILPLADGYLEDFSKEILDKLRKDGYE